VQLGVPPSRIDVLTDVTGLRFSDEWPHHIEGTIEGVRVPVIGLDSLIRNKRAAGRHKDLGDVEALDQHRRRKKGP